METAWQGFAARASAASDLDGLIAAHEAHLATLLQRCPAFTQSQLEGSPRHGET